MHAQVYVPVSKTNKIIMNLLCSLDQDAKYHPNMAWQLKNRIRASRMAEPLAKCQSVSRFGVELE